MATSFESSRSAHLKKLNETSYIDAATFCDLAISPRLLERFSDSPDVLGLRDLKTGERFVVDAKVLRGHGISAANA